MKNENKTAEQIIDNFLADENLLPAFKHTKSANYFDIINIYEPKHSSFLAWLFNPLEAHGLNDLYIKKLLKICLQNCNLTPKEMKVHPFYKNYSIYDIDQTSFMNTYVYTEFKAGDPIRKKVNPPAIDLCLINHDQKLIIFIENKIGSKERYQQRSGYFNYLNSIYNDEFDCIYVYLDYYYKEDKTIEEKPWIFMNYDWIENSLKTILDRNLSEPSTNKILQDYYILLTGNYGIEPYFDGTQKAIKLLSKRHEQLIELVNNTNGKDKLIATCTFDELFALKENPKYEFFLKINTVYQKYGAIIDSMEEYCRFDFVAESLMKELNTIATFIDFDESDLFLTHPLFAKWGKDESDWAIYIVYSEHKIFSDSPEYETDEKSGDIEIYFDLNLVPDNYKQCIQDFILNTNSKCNPRNNSIEMKSFPTTPSNKELTNEFIQRYETLIRLATKVSEIPST